MRIANLPFKRSFLHTKVDAHVPSCIYEACYPRAG